MLTCLPQSPGNLNEALIVSPAAMQYCQRVSNAGFFWQCYIFLAMHSISQPLQSHYLLYAGCQPACSSESSGIRWQLAGPVWQCDSAGIGSRCWQVRAPRGWLFQVCPTILMHCIICSGLEQVTHCLQEDSVG